MSDFNPYREWLGIEMNAKPTYYQLLGLPPQTDAAAIRRRANQRVKQLAKLDVGDRFSLRQQIIDRIQRAAKCLTDEEQKAEYDRQLKEKVKRRNVRQSQRTSNDRPQPVKPKTCALDSDSGVSMDELPNSVNRDETAKVPAIRFSDASVTVPALDSMHQTGRRGIARSLNKKRKRSRVAIYSTLMSGISVLGVAYLLITQTDFGRNLTATTTFGDAPTASTTRRDITAPTIPAESQDASDSDDASDAPTELVNATSEDGKGTSLNPEPTMEVTMPPLPAPVMTQAELRELGESLSRARLALSNRDTQEAREILRQSKPLARRPQDIEKHNRLMRLTEYVASYWQASKDELKKLKGGNEIEIRRTPVMVVENNARHLILRAAGQNKTYSVEGLPVELATELADRWLDDNAASTKILRGAMMAVTAGFDTSEARQLWRAARLSGDVDIGDLELVLDDDYEVGE